MAFQPSEKSRIARKPNRCVLPLPHLRRRASDPPILACGFFGTDPHWLWNWRFHRPSPGLKTRPPAVFEETM